MSQPRVTDGRHDQGGLSPVAPVSSRELDVLELLADGLSNDGIAARLFVSVKTVESTLRSIYLKLGLAEDGRDRNRRVNAAVYFLSRRTRQPPLGLGVEELSETVASAPFDAVVTMLEEHAARTDSGAWRLYAAAAWYLAIVDDLDHALDLAGRATRDLDHAVASSPVRSAAGTPGTRPVSRVIVDVLTATLNSMRGTASLDHAGLDELAWFAALPLRHPDREVFDGVEAVLEIANWFTFSDRAKDAAAILDRRIYRTDELDDLTLLSAWACQAELDIRRGRWRRGEAELDRLVQRGEALGHSNGYGHVLSARLHAGRGEIERTTAHLRAARLAATELGDHSTQWRADAAQGLLALSVGDARQAVVVLSRVYRRTLVNGLRLPSVRMWEADLVEALVGCGDRAGAITTTEWLRADVAATGSVWGAATLSRCAGLVAVDPAEAAGHFEASATSFADLDAPFERARSELLLGQSLAPGHGSDLARFQVRRAQESFETIGADPWTARAQQWLAQP